MSRRPYLTCRQLSVLAASLTDADRAVLDTLRRVRLATGEQLVRLHYDGRPSAARQARRQLARLVDHRLLCRLDRRVGGVRAGSDGFVYSLDVAGQRLAGAARPGAPRRPWTPGLPFLAHSLAITGLFVGLVESERRGEVDLLDFTTEPNCWRSFAGPGGGRMLVKPDAYARLGVGEDELRWFVEVDRDTEAPTTLHRKAEVYKRYWQSGREQAASGLFPKVLWVVPNEDRSAVVVDVLARQPAEAWVLFQVVTDTAAVRVLSGGQP